MTTGMRIQTHSGSTYLVGPGGHGRVRVARVSDHVVRGTVGPVTFVEEFERVELVAHGEALVLRCTAVDGTTFQTSAIRRVDHESLVDAGTAAG